MDVRIEGKKTLHGTVTVPGDKSISHRAVMLGCLASGKSIIQGLSTAQDVGSTIRAFRRMGISIDAVDDVVEIHGVGLGGFCSDIPDRLPDIDCENSGTTARLLMGLLSGAGKHVRLTGDSSLCRRPMMRVDDPLSAHGAGVESTEGRLPVTLTGTKMLPIHYRVPVPSAQVKSSLLLASLFIDGVSVIVETQPTRDHTERMLQHMNGPLEIVETQTGSEMKIRGMRELHPLQLNIPGDISSAVFFIAAALVTPGSSVTIRNVLLNPTRSHILDVFKRMDARIETEIREEYPELVGDVHVQHSELRGVSVGGSDIPLIIDEIPALAVCALFARGDTVVEDAGELRIKESDRIESIVSMITAFGGGIEAREQGFTVRGGSGCRSAEADSHGDHRIAMAASILALACEGSSTIKNADCVNISFPEFFQVLNRNAT